MHRFYSILPWLLLIFIFSCPMSTAAKNSTIGTSPSQDTILMQSPITAHLVEQPAQALEVWRSFQEERPTLVMLSHNPSLQPIPDALINAVQNSLASETAQVLNEKVSFMNPDPLLLPSMALSGALQTKLFSRVVWVFPSEQNEDTLDLETFRRQLLTLGAISSAEAATLTRDGSGFAGILRNTPFQAVPHTSLPELNGPVLLHIDLEYFKPLYKGEIKTRLYKLLYATMGALREQSLATRAVTISYSNISGALPLSVRFIGPVLAELIRQPALLNQALPVYWSRHSNALYLPIFFQSENVKQLYLEMEDERPDDPAVKYGLYQASRQLKDGAKALDYLAQAVEIDTTYAYEYLNLASVAADQELPDQALRMVQLIDVTLPGNPFITLELARAMIAAGQGAGARLLLQKLQSLNWSKAYYPGMPAYLQQLLDTTTE